MNIKNVSREEFINKNLGLVHACARRFFGKGIEYDDLYSAGCMGIVKAYDRFDNSRGVKFSTYAVPVIIGEIKRLFRDDGAIKVSRSLKELSMKVLRKQEELVIKTGREPTINELALNLDLPPEKVTEAICAASSTISLTESYDDSDNGQIDLKFKEVGLKLTDKIAIKDALTKLSQRDRTLILMRYFFDQTQTQTAKKMGMTQVQVSRQEKRILNNLKKLLNC